MPGRTSGLERDLNLVRRRAWLFIPFLVLGILIALAFGSFAGDSNAVANMTIDTIVHDVVAGGDRGLRIFEAQAMVNDDRFKAKVIERIGDPNFDYSRFSVSLSPISVADGVSRGVLTVSVLDPAKVNAEKYRQAFVEVYSEEFTAQDGLFRQRFVDRRLAIAQRDAKVFQDAYRDLRALADPKGVDVDQLLDVTGATTPAGYLYERRAALRADLAEVDGAIKGVEGTSPSVAAVVASAALGQPVATGDAAAALGARRVSLQTALTQIAAQISAISAGKLDPDLQNAVDLTYGYRVTKTESYIRYANANVAAQSAESTITVGYTFSGGLSGSILGRIAVALAVTVVFGLIAIYTVEWLSQLRTKPQD